MSNNTITHAPTASPIQPADTQTPPVQPGHRLVPALIGTINHHQIAHIECPNWCLDDHTDEPHSLHEITHNSGDEDVQVATFTDPVTLALHWSARISAAPASPHTQVRAAHIVVDDESTEARLTPVMAEELADDLTAFTAYLRQLARTVRAANLAADRLPLWTSLDRTDLQTMPVADLIKAFGVTVEETVGSTDHLRVSLVGEPGSMRLLVHPSAPQHVREELTRTGMLAWFDARFGGDRV